MKKIEKYHQTDNARYALKHTKESLYLKENGSDAYVQAAGDLALEAEFLANLTHPNIIKLRGLTHAGTAGFADGPCGYFLIIDRLFETLDQRIKRWHGPTKAKKGRVTNMMSVVATNFKKSSGGEGIEIELRDDIMDERYNVAAMTYLHSHSIIFRDLKPANIGFDVRGDVKIFDFGLARIMPEGGTPYDDLFEMSGAGSPRYMAPELLSGKAYNMKADVYTFAIVLWEMLSGEIPYSFVRSRDQLCNYVCQEHGRPEIDESWPSNIKGMLRSSFDDEVYYRPVSSRA
ncbi:hypothetical protein ACHAXR_001425 [Thalassiosira sp. AJA248-18]